MRQFPALCITGFAVFMLLAVFGCGMYAHQPEPVRYWTLDYDPPATTVSGVSGLKKSPGNQYIIYLKPLDAPVPYNTNRIIYAANPFQRSQYAYHRWVAPPADMLTGLLLRDIEAAGIAEGTISGTPAKSATHRIEGRIIEFLENDEPDRWEAVLVLRLEMLRIDPVSRESRVVFRKTYRQQETLQKNNPHALARSMSKAMEAVSQRFIADIEKNFP